MLYDFEKQQINHVYSLKRRIKVIIFPGLVPHSTAAGCIVFM
jgi:hypothetical protein